MLLLRVLLRMPVRLTPVAKTASLGLGYCMAAVKQEIQVSRSLIG